jgi:hypothetical protein
MKKVKKMAFGGMGSGMGAGMVGNRSMQTKPQSVMQKMAQAQPRGALGGNQAPAGANLLKAYNAQGSGSAPPPANPNLQKSIQAFNQQKNMGAPTTTNPPNRLTSVNPRDLKQIGVKAGVMKNGGKVKSASARADGCAIRGKTRA